MTDYSLEATRLSWPAAWQRIFGRAAPLILEIGFGSGDFLLRLAREKPEANILGLEISLPSIRRGERKLSRAGLKNARIVRAEAHQALWTLCRPGEIGDLYINYPDPWPKDSHQHRRLIGNRFLQLAGSRMIRDGRLQIVTDHPGYAGWIAERLQNSQLFENTLPTTYASYDKPLLETKYEYRALSEGRKGYYFAWKRTEVPASTEFAIPREYAMPHAVISTPPDLDEIVRRFVPRHWSREDTVVRLIELYASSGHDSLVIDVFIGEEPLDQRMLIALTLRGEGDLLIHLHEIGYPRATSGVHFAIWQVANWVCSLRTGARLRRHNLQRISGSE